LTPTYRVRSKCSAIVYRQSEAISGRSHTENCREAALDILLGRRPRRHADAHCGLTLPDRAAAPTRAFFLNPPDHVTRAFRIPESYEDLVEHDVIQHGVTRSGEPVGKPCRMATGAFDQISQALPSKLTQRGPDLDDPCSGKACSNLPSAAIASLVGATDRASIVSR
jgi:hypothetical protein